jgi:YidC/Oxa1 family membrane protein insertase
MTDMRRTILWMVFTFSLFLLWDAWNTHNGRASFFTPSSRPAATASGDAASGAASGVPAAVAQPAAGTAATPVAAAAATQPAETIDVTTDVYKATISTRGGDLVRLELLKYTDADDRSRNLVLFDHTAGRTYAAQTGLITLQPGASLPNHLAMMTAAPGERTLKPGADAVTVRLETAAAGGVRLAKTYTFRRGQYTIGVQHAVTNSTDAPVTPQLYLQLLRDGTVPTGSMFMAPTSFTGPAMYTETRHFQKIEFGDIEKNKTDHDKSADNGWVGMVQHYFNSAWLVPAKSAREFRTAKVGENLYSIAMVLPLGTVEAGATATHEATLFAGPQEEKKLEALAPGLELVKDYGIFTVIAKPLFWLLDVIHRVVGNWGWAIVGLVVLLKAAFYWLNASAYRSMAKMKAINPRVMELRERYKDKPQQMQQEMMRIYREEKVNPLGGCLPIVVQMPFFIALYWVLLSTVEMRDAPWIGWITDLSSKDPYYILPLLMTASTLFQTWLNPTPPDPVQARMMWIMPLLFSVFFFFFPAGLVLYWLTNNLLGIAQQWFINRKLGVK